MLNKLKHQPWYQWIFLALCAVFLLCLAYTLWTVFYSPVYNDEGQWKLTVSRLFLDSGYLINLFPACSEGFLLKSPWTWYPVRILDALIYADASNPFYLRQYGWFIYLGLLALWSSMCHFCIRLSWGRSLLMVSAFFMVGTMPFLMVWNRPEQPIMIWITAGLLLGVYFYQHYPQKTALKVIVFILFALIGCCISASHAKGVYFLPLFLVLWYRMAKTPWSTIALGTIYLWSFLETLMLWKARTLCAESEWWTNMVKSFTIQPKLLITNPHQFFDGGAHNVMRWFDYVNAASFKIGIYNSYLVGHPVNSAIDQFALNAVGFSVYVRALLIAINLVQILITSYQQGAKSAVLTVAVCLLFTVILFSLNHFSWWGIIALGVTLVFCLLYLLVKKSPSNWVIALSLGICLMILMFTQILKNYYEASLVWPVWLLIGVFTFTVGSTWGRATLKYVLLPLLLLMAIASTQLRWDLIGMLPLEWQKTRIERQEDNAKFLVFAKQACGINDERSSLVLDDETYPIFWRHPKPMFTAYLYGWYAQGTDYKKTFLLQKPGGLATNCNSVPLELLPYVKQMKHFCCASQDAIEAFNKKTLKTTHGNVN